jgi:hypothetical protein
VNGTCCRCFSSVALARVAGSGKPSTSERAGLVERGRRLEGLAVAGVDDMAEDGGIDPEDDAAEDCPGSGEAEESCAATAVGRLLCTTSEAREEERRSASSLIGMAVRLDSSESSTSPSNILASCSSAAPESRDA